MAKTVLFWNDSRYRVRKSVFTITLSCSPYLNLVHLAVLLLRREVRELEEGHGERRVWRGRGQYGFEVDRVRLAQIEGVQCVALLDHQGSFALLG